MAKVVGRNFIFEIVTDPMLSGCKPRKVPVAR